MVSGWAAGPVRWQRAKQARGAGWGGVGRTVLVLNRLHGQLELVKVLHELGLGRSKSIKQAGISQLRFSASISRHSETDGAK